MSNIVPGLNKVRDGLLRNFLSFFVSHSAKNTFLRQKNCISTFRVYSSLWLIYALSLAFSGARPLRVSLLGSLCRSCVAPVYPTLHCAIRQMVEYFYDIHLCKVWTPPIL